MNMGEFEALAGTISNEAFETVNFVYTYHPAISETNGKQQIADLFKNFGMRVIMDMHPTAAKAKALEEDIRRKTLELAELRERLNALREG